MINLGSIYNTIIMIIMLVVISIQVSFHLNLKSNRTKKKLDKFAEQKIFIGFFFFTNNNNKKRQTQQQQQQHNPFSFVHKNIHYFDQGFVFFSILSFCTKCERIYEYKKNTHKHRKREWQKTK